ncbi:serine hydrolase domain-containing protein [Meridianimarinicoccus aquatilis]|uniref:Class C beta-lactamase-related serine hydrolase n=1 Tax=Meridianimarinicoccus aquatilis TaxID=2552766 RepID=A0A4R6B516_9RHOB|nr:serine hydrolase [Fluviibacterium aquatile]TDL90616.1 class C beta-lactamase-related serine hydrolase [Fluviibacterium aquatile]
MTRITRRALMLSAPALALPGILRAQSNPFAAAARRAQGLDQLHSLTIVKNGETVVAQRVRGPGLDTPVNVKSVSKTVVAALTGAAIDRNELPGLQAKLGDLAPRLIPSGADPRVALLTVENLLTLQAGLERTSGGNYGAWVGSRNWIADALGRPFVAEPGARMLYSTGTTHVLGAVLAEVTGRSLLSLSREWLGAPLGIDIPAWTRDPQGFYMGGNEMALAPIALARFGEMFRLNGMWQGNRVLPSAWVSDSFRARTRSPWSGLGYGLGWFLGNADGARFALARGYGGQVVVVVPDRALTIVITSDPTRPARSQGYFGDLLAMIEQDILPNAPRA